MTTQQFIEQLKIRIKNKIKEGEHKYFEAKPNTTLLAFLAAQDNVLRNLLVDIEELNKEIK